jgi:hypothetical protein
MNVIINSIIKQFGTSHNKRFTLRRLTAARATQNSSRAYALCAVLFRHIFAVAGTLRVPLSQPQKRRIPRTLSVIRPEPI